MVMKFSTFPCKSVLVTVLAVQASATFNKSRNNIVGKKIGTLPSNVKSVMEHAHGRRRDVQEARSLLALNIEGSNNSAAVGESDESVNHGHGDESTTMISALLCRGGAKTRVLASTTVKPSPVSQITQPTVMEQLMTRLKIGFYFALWYVLNVMYNIMNKKLMNIIPAPLTLGTIQLFIGGGYAALLWLLKFRATPQLTPEGRVICRNVGFYHGAGQLASMASMGAGPISFTHIVKALEPFFSAICSALIFGKWFPPQVYMTLIPVVGGVGYACMKEPSFSMLAFLTAMGSNLAFALRAVVSKNAMTTYIGENLSSTNLFGIITIYSAFLMVPVALLTEQTSILGLWKTAVQSSGKTQSELVRAVLVSGLFHYLNNEVMYLALGNVHPVTLAVGNTMKRVFILVASVLVFRNPVTLQAAVGSAVGISGVLLYSLTKAHYERLEQA